MQYTLLFGLISSPTNTLKSIHVIASTNHPFLFSAEQCSVYNTTCLFTHLMDISFFFPALGYYK